MINWRQLKKGIADNLDAVARRFQLQHWQNEAIGKEKTAAAFVMKNSEAALFLFDRKEETYG